MHNVSCHDYEGVMSVLCTPLQVKFYTVKYFMKLKTTKKV